MENSISSKIFLGFNLICLSAAIALTSYWVYIFFLNEDLVTIDYKKYYDNEKDSLPVLSLCLKNSISNDEIKSANQRFNASTYLKFLKGEIFDPELLHLDYKTIIVNMTHFIEEDFIRYRNGTVFALHPAYQHDPVFGDNFVENKQRMISSKYAFFHYSNFFVCYDLSTPHDSNINQFYYRVNSNIFPLGIRPSSYGLMMALHSPHQLLISGNREHKWPQPRDKNDSYEMKFHIHGVEVLRRRKKDNRPCNQNWEEHDNLITKQHTQNIGCTLPYLDKVEGIPPCTTKEQMKKKFHFREDHYGVNPPCREMKNIRSSYQESTYDPSKLSWARKGYFWIGLIFPQDDFKEISQTR